jgi:drug/metabolite transporter (DMT)-like permease
VGTLPGVLLATGCAALGSFYAVLVKPVMARHGGLKIIALTMVIGGIGLWLLVGAAWGKWVNPASIVDKPALAAVLAVLILASYPTPLQVLAIVLVTSCVLVELFWPRLRALARR